ncbi:Gfo/Idh/MocA family oxidoreductase [Rubellicoccus peritrichatus]|uniref:Gfo/Idh/MocA family oxidoreductase n=1 Tax=Rubellicoccus peritrichatus TaxID=3080537 RepID=A0AAQ3LAY4_9BACT|nr:Gfo/Idh/MocA family oxidoreductase [Puniceicoccus sp. CR14]WOO40912.1 Gfo/Idh/MocA family oxidoreductase [Puniceicoccus sp. CR14]
MKKLTRRDFIIASSAAAISPFAIGKSGPSANSQLNLALVGVGGVAKWTNPWAWKHNVIAMCDVDQERAAPAYAEVPNAEKFRDFRVMFDKLGKQIDGVVINTPDHTHFPASIAAMERGIHVFVQKPATHDIWQSRTLLKAARHYDVVTQMGNQGHATEGIRLAKEWYDAGVIGEVREVIAWTNRPSSAIYNSNIIHTTEKEIIPDTLDWDLWLGPTDFRYYSKWYAPGHWRWRFDFGSGALGDIGCHTLDTAIWALGLGMPSKIDVGFHDEGDQPNSLVTYHFPARGQQSPVKVKWYEGLSRPPVDYLPEPKPGAESEGGLIMVGSKQTFYHFDMRPNSVKLLMPKEEWREFRQTLPKRTIPRIKGSIQDDWARGITDGTTPCSNFEVSTKLNEMILLGVLAQRAGHSIAWDEANMNVPGHSELNSIIKQPVREGWSYGEDLWS